MSKKKTTKTKTLRKIKASAEEMIQIVGGAGSIQMIEGVAGQDGAVKIPRFQMKVYTGGPMRVPFFGQVVIDLEGLQIPNESPAFRDHDPSKILGHGTARIEGSDVLFDGEVSGSGQDAQEFVTNSGRGFPWQSSIGVNPIKIEELEAGAEAEVNGKTVNGPISIVRESLFKEGSAVALGADSGTHSKVAAKSGQKKEDDMNFEEWIKGMGLDIKTLNKKQKEELKKTFKAIQAQAANPPAPEVTPPPAPEVVPLAGSQNVDPAVQLEVKVKAAIATERSRVAGIEAACRWGYDESISEKVEEIRAKAIGEGHSVDSINAQLLTVVRESRKNPGSPAIRGEASANTDAIEAALCLNARLDPEKLLKDYGEKTMNAADKIRGLRLREVMAMCAERDGITLPRVMGTDNAWIKAAFTSISLPNILSAVANKALLDSYNRIPADALRIAAKRNVSDFKVHNNYRLTGNMVFEKVQPGGELKHGTIGELAFTNQAETYGKFFMLTRQDVINDDLGAFLKIPQMIGRGAALSLQEVFWTLVLSNPSSFWAAANNNYQEGAATALDADSLQTAVQLFLDQTDPDGKPILLEPRFLVIPTSLKFVAEQLFESVAFLATGTNNKTKIPQKNLHAGKYEPISTPYLNSQSLAGSSAVGWYLFGDPADVPSLEIAFLNGVETPTIESVDAPPDQLGMGFRGWMDFGVKEQDPRGSIFSKGEA